MNTLIILITIPVFMWLGYRFSTRKERRKEKPTGAHDGGGV